MNDTTQGKDLAIPSDFVAKLMAGIAQSRATTPSGPGGKPILRLLKDGMWVFGQENNDVQEGSRWVVNPMTLAHGWVCWVENTIAGQTMVSMAEALPARPVAIDGRQFEQQRSFDLKCIDGDDKGQEVVYKSSSMGGVERVTDLIGLIQPRLATPYPCPVLRLEQDHYTHKKYGRIYKPIFEVCGWADMNGVVEGEHARLATSDPEPAAPARKRKAALSTATPEQAPVTAAPPASPLEPAPTAQAHTGQRRRPGSR